MGREQIGDDRLLNRRLDGGRRMSKGRTVVTIYVDNLSEDMDVAWLGQIFSKYGCVLDAFIPKKRSRGFNSKFGFVRFGSLREAEEAISSLNGMSYAEAVSGSKSNGPRRINIEANPIEWLHRSAVAKLRSLSVMEVIREVLHREGAPQTEVRDMGGLWVVLTFSSTDSMKSVLEGGKLNSLNKWVEEVHQWSPELPIVRRRNVWISCYGVPLHGWSVATFHKIAQLWGEVLSVDDATVKGTSFAAGKILIAANSWDKINESICLELNGRSFEVRVVEDQVDAQGNSGNPNFTEPVEKPNSPVYPVENSVGEMVLKKDLIRVNSLRVEPASSCTQPSSGCSRVDETALVVGERGMINLNSCVENVGDKVEFGDKVGLHVDQEFVNLIEVLHKEVGPVGVNNLGLYSISEDGQGDNIINAVGHTPVMEKPINIFSGAATITENHQVEEIGRPVVFSLAAEGEAGVRKVLQMLRDEFELTMALSGCRSLSEITRNHIVADWDLPHPLARSGSCFGCCFNKYIYLYMVDSSFEKRRHQGYVVLPKRKIRPKFMDEEG
ncbi:hypothetical protein Vadar_015904 [Vaccinium darrowii]|uniref:Uncharacterized protein n=1 Tax=Vaccinium darrowii TaxID=229202 RepID=A0ACB7XRT1_9ERIC|nr:hypothetical protein Vadar_015904 [Vaccinium darrowii]